MKIGILTFHFGNNYGGILQCYALQQILERQGKRVEILNFTPESAPLLRRIISKLKSIESVSAFGKFIFDFFGTTVKGRLHGKQNLCQQEILAKFDEFRRLYLHLSPVLTEETIGAYCRDFDAIVVGSDQVWTSLYENPAVYFLDWMPRFPGRKFSYAACSAYGCVRRSRATRLRAALEDFTAVSVRDTTTANLVENITGVRPPIVFDPTLLYDFAEFQQEEKATAPYILTYILGGEIVGGHKRVLSSIKQKYNGAAVYAIIIPGAPNEIVKYADRVFAGVSPVEWVNLFANACFVYTDSFHGCMFSLKFHIPFVGYYTNAIRASRLIDLRDRLHLDNIVVASFDLERIEMNTDSYFDMTDSLNFLSEI